MDSLLGPLFILALIVGFIRGLTDKRPSFWRGFGEGLAGKGEFRGSTYLFSHDTHTGLGMGVRMDDE